MYERKNEGGKMSYFEKAIVLGSTDYNLLCADLSDMASEEEIAKEHLLSWLEGKLEDILDSEEADSFLVYDLDNDEWKYFLRAEDLARYMIKDIDVNEEED